MVLKTEDLKKAYEILKSAGVLPPVEDALIEMNIKELEEFALCLNQ